jgi:hypothetical protein
VVQCIRCVCVSSVVFRQHGRVCPDFVASFMGGAATRPATVYLYQPSSGNNVTFAEVSFRRRSLQSPLYYGYRFGRFVPPHFAVEGEFIHMMGSADLDKPVAASGTIDGDGHFRDHSGAYVCTVVRGFPRIKSGSGERRLSIWMAVSVAPALF